MKVALYTHPDCALHDTGRGHPERAARLRAVWRGALSGLGACCSPEEGAPLEPSMLYLVHTPSFVHRARLACAGGIPYLDSLDNPICPDSFRAALAAAGTVLSACAAVAGGRYRRAFCAVRPPGHHALPGRAMGFCMFNNVAIAARWLLSARGLERVLVVDLDSHHGNGTQQIFYEDPRVLYYSIHQARHFPGTGARDERGAGPGLGYTINVPVWAGAGDEEILAAARGTLPPAAEWFRPQFVILSMGFDGHVSDRLSGLRLTARGFAELSRLCVEVAEEYAEGRLVSALEGGYALRALETCTAAHTRVLAGGASEGKGRLHTVRRSAGAADRKMCHG